MMPRVAREIWIAGAVQGVAFRHFTKVRARELGLSGYVENLRDGRVHVCVEGEASPVSELVRWLERGPPSARVEEIEVRESEPAGAVRFDVRR